MGRRTLLRVACFVFFVWTLQPQFYVHIHFQNQAFILRMILITEQTNICILWLLHQITQWTSSDLHHLFILFQTRLTFFCRTQKKIFRRMLQLFLSIQWKSMKSKTNQHWIPLTFTAFLPLKKESHTSLELKLGWFLETKGCMTHNWMQIVIQ